MHISEPPPADSKSVVAATSPGVRIFTAMMLSTSEVIPIVDGRLALGTWQSVLFLELDGPRRRTLFVQVWGV